MSYTLALGPFEASWRGPQRLLLSVEREHVVDCDYHDEYNGRGYAEQLPRLSLDQALHVVTRICDTSAHAHALAFCQALEALTGVTVHERAEALRTLVAELERLVSHLGAVRQILDTLGLQRHSVTITKLLATSREALQLASGSPAVPDSCMPGGVSRDLQDDARVQLLTLLQRLHRQLYTTSAALIDQRSIVNRIADIGVLSRDAAASFGVRGPLARASGVATDTRFEQPYAFYGMLERQPVVQEGGDVYARLVVLLLESVESVKMVEQTLERLPPGAWQGAMPTHLTAGEGSAAVESPHGMLRYTLQSDGKRLTAVQIDAPRQLDRLLARTFLVGALVDNIPLIVSSLDVCVACAEQ